MDRPEVSFFCVFLVAGDVENFRLSQLFFARSNVQ